MRIIISNPSLVYKKIATLFVATIALVPLVHNKMYISASIYLTALLLLHVFILYIYFMKVTWREFMEDKKELFVRLSGIAFFIYLLSSLRFEGATTIILLNMAGAFVIHLAIILFMTASVVRENSTA